MDDVIYPILLPGAITGPSFNGPGKIWIFGNEGVLNKKEKMNDSTQYLAEKLALSNGNYSICDCVWKYLKINIDINEDLFMCNNKKTDPGIVLHELNITQRNSLSELLIYCFGTGVLLMLLHYVEDICSSTVFETRNKKIHLELYLKIWVKLPKRYYLV